MLVGLPATPPTQNPDKAAAPAAGPSRRLVDIGCYDLRTMTRSLLRRVLLILLGLFAAFYGVLALLLALDDEAIEALRVAPAPTDTIAIFGASGTAGDGILKAALADPRVRRIHVITRRVTPRMESGEAAGKVQVTRHMDYLDYAAIREQVAEADAVFWAIGISSRGVDEETYGRIHVDFPRQFVTQWLQVSRKPAVTFHYISSSDISEDSRMMWAREKVRAEKTLFALAEGSSLNVVFYRPDYIGPTREEAHPGQRLLYGFFAPVGAAVKAVQIGQAMLEMTARADSISHGDTLDTRDILLYSDAYERRTN